jgi:hypothetical protein
MKNQITLLIRLWHYLNRKETKTEEETILTVDIELELENFFESDGNFEDHMRELHAQNYE